MIFVLTAKHAESERSERPDCLLAILADSRRLIADGYSCLIWIR
ncbi:MAG: hypothetical protein OXN27_18665 [Candidatus Poribacteria bacterium]|nr:hypothetical protein [Candidatus Poribacteria bacterium]